jgi:transposase
VQDSKKPVASIARDLGIHSSTIYYWLRKKKGDVGLNINENTSPEMVRQLKRELDEVRLERDILKKVVAIFSKQPK